MAPSSMNCRSSTGSNSVKTENKHLGRFLGAAATDQERDEKSAEQKYALNPLSYLP